MQEQKESAALEGVSVVVPAFNEEAAIGDDLDSIKSAMDKSGRPYEIIVVDDGSSDRTAEIAASRPWVRLVRHIRNKGGGATRKRGIEEARYDVIAITDADGTYPVDQIPALVEFIRDYDLVIGARKLEAGTMKWLRAPAKWLLRKLAEFVTTFKIPDLNTGMRVFRRSTIRKFYHLLPERHSWVSTMTIAYLANNFDVKNVFIDYFPRKGKSSFHPIKDGMFFFLLIFRTTMYFKPMKVLLPVSLVIFLLFLVKVFVVNTAGFTDAPDIREFDVLLFMLSIAIGVAAFFADMLSKFFRKF